MTEVRTASKSNIEPPPIAPRRKRRVWELSGLAAIAVGLIVVTGKWMDFRPIDLGNYLAAARLLVAGTLPYGKTEFFAPPWIAAMVYPLLLLPASHAGVLWLAASMAAICTSAALHLNAIRYPRSPFQRILLTAASGLLPASLFVYITGQITGIVSLGLIGLWLSVRRQPARLSVLAAILSLLLLTAKPHLVMIPAGLCILEAIRLRRWTLIAAMLLALTTLALLTTALYPSWPREWIATLVQGDYLGGPGLAARGFRGYRALGVGFLWFVPLAAYLLVAWCREGLSASVLGIAIVLGIMVVPYSRAYDYVMLLPAAWTALMPGGRLRPARWIVIWLSLTLLSLSPLSLLTPPMICLALLLFRATDPAGKPLSTKAQGAIPKPEAGNQGLELQPPHQQAVVPPRPYLSRGMVDSGLT